MRHTAELVQANLSRYCPITNLYKCSDDTYLLVTLPSLDVGGTLTSLGFIMPILETHLNNEVDVFLSDEDGTVLDYDGDPSNGMTPINSFEVLTHADALAALGYDLA